MLSNDIKWLTHGSRIWVAISAVASVAASSGPPWRCQGTFGWMFWCWFWCWWACWCWCWCCLLRFGFCLILARCTCCSHCFLKTLFLRRLPPHLQRLWINLRPRVALANAMGNANAHDPCKTQGTHHPCNVFAARGAPRAQELTMFTRTAINTVVWLWGTLNGPVHGKFLAELRPSKLSRTKYQWLNHSLPHHLGTQQQWSCHPTIGCLHWGPPMHNPHPGKRQHKLDCAKTKT